MSAWNGELWEVVLQGGVELLGVCDTCVYGAADKLPGVIVVVGGGEVAVDIVGDLDDCVVWG